MKSTTTFRDELSECFDLTVRAVRTALKAVNPAVEATGWYVPLAMLAVPLAYTLWFNVLSDIIVQFRPDYFGTGYDVGRIPLGQFIIENPLWLVRSILREEDSCRLPVCLLALLFARQGWTPARVMATVTFALALSAWFGWLHGGPKHLPFEGIAGIMLCWLLMKCGATKPSFAKALKAFMAVILTHLAYDAVMFWLAAR
jgi:hypothetical protein